MDRVNPQGDAQAGDARTSDGAVILGRGRNGIDDPLARAGARSASMRLSFGPEAILAVTDDNAGLDIVVQHEGTPILKYRVTFDSGLHPTVEWLHFDAPKP